MEKALYDRLLQSPYAKDVSTDDFYKLMEGLKPTTKEFTKGTTIRREGTIREDFGYVLDGEVLQTRIKTGGERAIFETCGVGQMFGEILFLLPHRTEWANDIIAKTDCTVMFFSVETAVKYFTDLNMIPHTLLVNFVFSMAKRVEGLMIALRCFRTRSVRQRISTYIFERSIISGKTQMMLQYNRDELADYLFLPRPSLSRELAAMKNDGIIDYYKSSIKILDMDLLRQSM